MKIWTFSDTHGKHMQVRPPEGVDMAIFAGDAGTYRNPVLCEQDYRNFLTWFDSLDIKYKTMINGNHCTAFEQGLVKREDIPESITYLENESVTIEGIKIYGSPQTPYFCDWAYNVVPEKIDEYWKMIDDDADIIVTHGPPKNILDRCIDGYRAGCPKLLDRIKVIRPKYHIFGHIHEDGGKIENNETTQFINASVVNEDYHVVNDGIIVEY